MEHRPAPWENLSLADFIYELPEHRIPDRPLPVRDASKLLVYQGGKISHSQFSTLDELLQPTDVLIFNNTRVIPARFHGARPSGGAIETLLMHPHAPADMTLAMQAKGSAFWQCIVRNLKRWKTGETATLTLPESAAGIEMTATLIDRNEQIVRFDWLPAELSFADVVSKAGELPLPPYMKRDADQRDRNDYQTVYARLDGAVAAPTAGLHFTPALLDRLRGKGVGAQYLTLHVSAGTFLPVKTDTPAEHPMHAEQIVVSADDLRRLCQTSGRLIPVGTTSMRCLESLAWLGWLIRQNQAAYDPEKAFEVPQLIAYQTDFSLLPEGKIMLGEVLAFMEKHNLEKWIGETRLMILPGYRFLLTGGLITNFHQPGSTLILLVATWIGNDWRSVYQSALDNDYRFLSYGDSSLLLPKS